MGVHSLLLHWSDTPQWHLTVLIKLTEEQLSPSQHREGEQGKEKEREKLWKGFIVNTAILETKKQLTLALSVSFSATPCILGTAKLQRANS